MEAVLRKEAIRRLRNVSQQETKKFLGLVYVFHKYTDCPRLKSALQEVLNLFILNEQKYIAEVTMNKSTFSEKSIANIIAELKQSGFKGH